MEQCMKSIIKKILRKMISCKSKEQCHGCLTDHPSQKQHMEMGCLSPWEEKRDLYLTDCMNNIPQELVVKEFEEINGEESDGEKYLCDAKEDRSFQAELSQL